MVAATPTASTGRIDVSVTAMSMARPPKRSVSGPVTMRPRAPTRIGVATSSDASALDSDMSRA